MIKPAKKIIICTKDVDTNDSGVYIPTDEKNKPEVGVVYAIGSGEPPINVKVGDRVVYRKYSESEVFINNEKYNFLDFKDIVAVITKEKDENAKN